MAGPVARKLNPDQLRQAEIDRDPLAKLIHDQIAKLPAERRLYPDLYAVDVANAVRAARA